MVQGTTADLRFLDGAIDPSDRVVGTSLWGPPAIANYLPVGIGRCTTLRSWINQWSLDHTLGDSLRWLPELTTPVMVILGSADPVVTPSMAQQMFDATTQAPRELLMVPGATHYFEGQAELLADARRATTEWIATRVTMRDYLGLRSTDDPNRWQLELTPRAPTPVGATHGGAALAATIEALEGATDRPLIWATVHYLTHAGPRGLLDVDVSIEVAGHQTTQACGVLRHGDVEVLLDGRVRLGVVEGTSPGRWVDPSPAPGPDDARRRPPAPPGTESVLDHYEIRASRHGTNGRTSWTGRVDPAARCCGAASPTVADR